jgi:hypothetical protein
MYPRPSCGRLSVGFNSCCRKVDDSISEGRRERYQITWLSAKTWRCWLCHVAALSSSLILGIGRRAAAPATISQSPIRSLIIRRLHVSPPPSQQRPLVLNVAESPPILAQTRLVVIRPCCPIKKGPATEAEAMMWRVAPAGE